MLPPSEPEDVCMSDAEPSQRQAQQQRSGVDGMPKQVQEPLAVTLNLGDEQLDPEVEDYLYDFYYRRVVYARETVAG